MGLKVLHLPTSTGGQSWGLAKGEKDLGIKSKVLYTEQNWLHYECDICLHLEKKSKINKLIELIKTFFSIRNKYDVFHFNFGKSLIDFSKYGLILLDLPFYKGKRIFTFNGCDARQKYPTIERTLFSACHEKDCYQGICKNIIRDFIKKIRISKISKYANHIFALNPDLLYFLPKEKSSFLPYAIASWDEIVAEDYKIGKVLKILHAPTDIGAKGSKYILKALDNLKKKYRNLEINLVRNLSNKEALKLYREAHIVIDQVLIGWYGAFGVEVMKIGKPLAVYIREEDLKFISFEMAQDLKETIININPYNIEEELSKYIENPRLLFDRSKASLYYVNKWHNPKYVASIVKNIYES